MFKKRKSSRKESSRKSIPSIISADLDILGNLVSEGAIDIEGRVQGNVRADRVVIRKEGRVFGDVMGGEIHIYGQVRGLVKAKDVHLYESCRVEGTIMHELLSIEDGAFVDGKFKRTDKTAMERSRFDIEAAAEAENARDESEDATLDLLQNIRLISSKE
jgi:cytoskeletal protein CcmA (bactofilin family)